MRVGFHKILYTVPLKKKIAKQTSQSSMLYRMGTASLQIFGALKFRSHLKFGPYCQYLLHCHTKPCKTKFRPQQIITRYGEAHAGGHVRRGGSGMIYLIYLSNKTPGPVTSLPDSEKKISGMNCGCAESSFILHEVCFALVKVGT